MAISIYVASSWRNEQQPAVVAALREAGFSVYDFRNPAPGNSGFHWREIHPDWKNWSPARFKEALSHPVAEAGFTADREALQSCDLCVLVLPSGRSAHLEAGWTSGAGKPTCVLLAPGEPELMYKLLGKVALTIGEVVEWASNFVAKLR